MIISEVKAFGEVRELKNYEVEHTHVQCPNCSKADLWVCENGWRFCKQCGAAYK